MNDIEKLDLAFCCAKSRVVEQCRKISANPDEASGEVMLHLYQILCEYKELHSEVLESFKNRKN